MKTGNKKSKSKSTPVKFDPSRSFESPAEAVEYAKQQRDPIKAVKAIIIANLDMGEFGFASEVCREAEVIGVE